MFGAANKGALALVALGLMAIFNDDTARLTQVVYQVRTLAHIGLRNSNDIGMLGDSLRDQGHAHGQLLSLTMLAEALWKQGIDIYSDFDNRLLAAGEYFARVNDLSVATPFLPFGTTDRYYISDVTNRGWGGGNMALTILHGAYVVRKGLPAPYIARRLQEMPVDGAASCSSRNPTPRGDAARQRCPFPRPPRSPRGSATLKSGAPPTGEASYSDGTWTVQGGGRDIWGAERQLPLHLQSDHRRLRHHRESRVGPEHQPVRQSRRDDAHEPRARALPAPGWPSLPVSGSSKTCEASPCMAAPTTRNKAYSIPSSSYWVKLERIGNIVTGYVSPDGTNWAATDVGRIDAPPATRYVGLVVCSITNGTLNTSTFSNVQITGGNGGAPIVTPAAPAALLASPGDKRRPAALAAVLRGHQLHGQARHLQRRHLIRPSPRASPPAATRTRQ